MTEFLDLEPEGIRNLLVFVGTEHVSTDGKLIGTCHIERTADGAFLAVVGIAL